MNFQLTSQLLTRLALAVVLVLPGMAMSREALLPFGPTEVELKSLPAACAARLKDEPATNNRWIEKIGRNNYLHVHHYCFGLNFINRAKFTFDKQNKRYYLEQAIGNFAYVLKNWSADSQLRPEAEAGMTEAKLMLQGL